MTLPPVPADFHWHPEPWGASLRCRPFTAIARHLFTTRQLAIPQDEAWEQVSASLGEASPRVARVRQVHGNDVLVIRAASDTWRGRPDVEADAVVTDDPALAVAVLAADCLPLLVADRHGRAVGAVHAGWRGTAAAVAVKAVHALEREFGCHPSDLSVVIGPGIGACCYEVGTELVDAFASAGHERHLIERWFSSPPPARGSRQRHALTLDLTTANSDQLVLAGVPAEAVHVASLCTAMHPTVLTSYRAEGTSAGRLAGVVALPLRR
ncbi:MAG: peptidoglycan editing factor PgeF [Vicinamibacterales bacterium]